ncbi:acyltransferase family protein [Flavilitoribacter nigricans]|uniref:Glucan biosynthesis protein n=1 Tax=Flavilitoribacter nigricans (strain ATCC 23147 / DSM 23189 / NBRC 102662 / NCIMB 1420 / SS-2) TaxID=1122177 RepID=A0A2D0N5T8_FLAN2|nr:acyltransferase family protein [Flavilitoribacter nigricans]PHN03143.1 glucan biosynthesis protein [Flavilitoribacter nigricans DSM 23189 = NBRC 102662]
METKIRRYDLDWIRVIVFGLLIFFHIGMFFNSWGWHIKNNVIYDWLYLPMGFLSQWRLTALFLISGMGTYFALSYRSGKVFARERLIRLGIPFLFGTLVLIAPQVYVERLVEGQFTGSYFEFYPIEFFKGIYPTGNFSWHHLWFLPYLLTYTLLLAPLFLYFRRHPENRFLNWCRKQIRKKYGLFLFIIPLYFPEAFIEPFFNVTHAYYGDWFAHAHYGIIFFYGFLFMLLREDFWAALDRLKQPALIIGLVTFSLLAGVFWQIEDGVIVHFTEAAVKVTNCFMWLVVIFGYGAKYLNRPSPLLAYCNRAVYPFYIFHQTLIIIFAYFLIEKEWSLGVKFTILTVATFFSCWGLYELVRRFKLGRILFGIKEKKAVETVPEPKVQLDPQLT